MTSSWWCLKNLRSLAEIRPKLDTTERALFKPTSTTLFLHKKGLKRWQVFDEKLDKDLSFDTKKKPLQYHLLRRFFFFIIITNAFSDLYSRYCIHSKNLLLLPVSPKNDLQQVFLPKTYHGPKSDQGKKSRKYLGQ